MVLACGSGQRHPSTIIDTQIIAIEADPPEANPDDRVDLTVTAADPKGRGLEFLMWSCVLYEGVCVESQLAPVEDWAVVARPEEGTTSITSTHRVPDEAWELLEIVNPVPTLVVALACPPGSCPIIAEVEALIERGEGSSTPPFAGPELAKDMADPSRWMGDLPVNGVSLAARVFPVSSRGEEQRNQNPEASVRFTEGDDAVIRLSAGEVLEMPFFVEDPNGETVYAFGYTTVGRFADRYVRSEDNAIRHYLIADQRGSGEIYIVFEDGDGGSFVWTKPLVVE